MTCYHWRIIDRNAEQVATADSMAAALTARATLRLDAHEAGVGEDVKYAIAGPYAGTARDAVGAEAMLTARDVLAHLVDCRFRQERDALARALASYPGARALLG